METGRARQKGSGSGALLERVYALLVLPAVFTAREDGKGKASFGLKKRFKHFRRYLVSASEAPLNGMR